MADRKIRVLHVLNDLGHRGGGTNKYVVNLAEKIDRSRFEFAVAYSSYSEDFIASFDSSVLLLPFSKKKTGFKKPHNWIIPLSIFGDIRRHDIDIVHTYLTPSCFWAWIAAKMAGRPALHFHVQSLLSGDVLSNMSRNHQWANRFVDGLVSYYQSPNEYINKEYSSYLGHDLAKYRVIPHGIDCSRNQRVTHCVPDVFKTLNIPHDWKLIGSMGRLSPDKRLDILLQILPTIVSRYPKVCLLLVGAGPELEKLKRMAHELDMAGHVRFVGFTDDVVPLYSVLTCHLYPGHREPGTPGGAPLMGMANMEAMACGSPVLYLAPDPEDSEMAAILVQDGVNGYVARSKAEFTEKILRLLDDEELRGVLGRQARDSIERNWNFDNHVSQLEQYYADIFAVWYSNGAQ